jgi:von Willebrand factor type A C-terminal domain/von Willebrand factor type A domain
VLTLDLQVFQNPYLPRGATEVNAVVSVSAGSSHGGHVTDEMMEVFLLDCSASMTDPPSKLAAVREATSKAIDRLVDGTWFAVVAGRRTARVVYPPPRWEGTGAEPLTVAASDATRDEARLAVSKLYAEGGTAISTWLAEARHLFAAHPDAIHHALLLTDGRNESEDPALLRSELQQCIDRFECDCRGVGTHWDRHELQTISDTLLGTTDIIPHPSQMGAEFEAIVERRMSKQVRSVLLQILTPVGGRVKFVKQVAPELVDLSGMATWMQPAVSDGEWRSVLRPDPLRPMVTHYPTGAWSFGEQRDYHVCLEVVPQEVGEANEVRAARVSLVGEGAAPTQAPVRAIWTDDAERATQINRDVAHYSGQEELAGAIEEGLQARRDGDIEAATRRLGRAVQLAAVSGNEGTRRLLEAVVEVEDAERGTVRLRTRVTKEDEMTLDTRSRRTVRLPRPAHVPSPRGEEGQGGG